jgi:hypothetical protein
MNNNLNVTEPDTIYRLTALWALSESFLGGILHAFKIPFTGLIVGNVAVIIIILIASLSFRSGVIMKACIITIIIKLIVSPYTPLTAHLAVFLQGLIGELVFWKRKNIFVSSISLGIITALLSSFQKIFFLTIIFGKNLWDSIDQFTTFVFKEVFGLDNYSGNIKLSFSLIALYTGIHLVFGFLSGLYGAKFEKRIKNKINLLDLNYEEDIKDIITNNMVVNHGNDYKRKRSKFLKSSKLIFFLFLLTILLLSYVYSGEKYFNSNSILFMIVRSVIFMFVWIKYLSPQAVKLLRNKFVKGNKYSAEAENIIKIFPLLKSIIKYSWKETCELKRLKRISGFMVLTTSVLLTLNINGKENLSL